ncbi:MAG: hypothetical protein M1826_004083 [Phylliscum demangeonii]|nr:MAG: hypothetical protein M1826_004083 [Phylliscum demangeonii]
MNNPPESNPQRWRSRTQKEKLAAAAAAAAVVAPALPAAEEQDPNHPSHEGAMPTTSPATAITTSITTTSRQGEKGGLPPAQQEPQERPRSQPMQEPTQEDALPTLPWSMPLPVRSRPPNRSASIVVVVDAAAAAAAAMAGVANDGQAAAGSSQRDEELGLGHGAQGRRHGLGGDADPGSSFSAPPPSTAVPGGLAAARGPITTARWTAVNHAPLSQPLSGSGPSNGPSSQQEQAPRPPQMGQAQSGPPREKASSPSRAPRAPPLRLWRTGPSAPSPATAPQLPSPSLRFHQTTTAAPAAPPPAPRTSSAAPAPNTPSLLTDWRPRTRTRAPTRPIAPSRTGAPRPAPRPPHAAPPPPPPPPVPVPVPTAAYIARASLAPHPLAHPQPLLVIIDLNGTLVLRPRNRHPSSILRRPGLRHLLRHLLPSSPSPSPSPSPYQVMIWSSAQPANVARMCREIFSPAQLARLAAVWNREKLALSPAQYHAKVQVYKRLEPVWADAGVAAAAAAAAAPGEDAAVWDQTNTVLVDDSVLKGAAQPFNIVVVPEFTGRAEEEAEKEMEKEGEGGPLHQLVRYLDDLRGWSDVSARIKRDPFVVGDERWVGMGKGKGKGEERDDDDDSRRTR